MSKDHFYFSRTDRIVALILLLVIIIATIISKPSSPPAPESGLEDDTLVHAPDTFRRTVYIRDTVRRTWYVWDTVSVQVNSVRYTAKKRPDSPLDLNALDSTELVRLPGIGPATAMKILRYREQLGGYSLITQLTEIEGLPDTLIKWFIVTDTVPVRKILINSATLTELRHHPYIDFYKARAIVEFRKERGKIEGPEQLLFLEEFTDQDLERLSPYLDFR